LLQLLLEHGDLLNIDISQGSVATHSTCGGIFKYEFVANLPQSLPVKEFRISLKYVGKLWAKVVSFFLTHGVDGI